MQFTIVPATAEHCEQLAPRLRALDVCDVIDRMGITPVQLLQKSIAISSHSWCWLADGKPVCMFGFRTDNIMAASATPWLLASNEIERVHRAFWLQSKDFIAYARSRFARITGQVDVRNTRSITWLRRLGFTVHADATVTDNGLRFHLFEMEN